MENIMHDPSESKNGVSMTREKQVNFLFLSSHLLEINLSGTHKSFLYRVEVALQIRYAGL